MMKVTRNVTCVLGQPDGWARGEREGYGGPYDVTSLSHDIPCIILRHKHMASRRKCPGPIARSIRPTTCRE